MHIPVIDIEPLVKGTNKVPDVARALHQACRDYGFFYITGHAVPVTLQESLQCLSRQFFDLPEPLKQKIAMERGGRAWRGYFPVHQELTSGQPDRKEGIYFGEELSLNDPRVVAGLPLHGPNLFPELTEFKPLVLDYMARMKTLGGILMRGLALSLQLPEDYFEKNLMSDPLILFRIFHYPSENSAPAEHSQWGVGEHTDYGALTILKQDSTGGLQIFSQDTWIDAPCIENSFICNIGDMLDKMTGGYYRSTPHRVKSNSTKNRLSFPFFYDLNFNASPTPIDLQHLGISRSVAFKRWDQLDLEGYKGSYGEYLVQKVSKVFPLLRGNLK